MMNDHDEAHIKTQRHSEEKSHHRCFIIMDFLCILKKYKYNYHRICHLRIFFCLVLDDKLPLHFTNTHEHTLTSQTLYSREYAAKCCFA